MDDAERHGCGIGLGLTSIIFGLAHFISLTYAILAALIGLYLGILLIAFDNPVVPMIVHAHMILWPRPIWYDCILLLVTPISVQRHSWRMYQAQRELSFVPG